MPHNVGMKTVACGALSVVAPIIGPLVHFLPLHSFGQIDEGVSF